MVVAIVCILWASLLLVTWGDQEGMNMDVHAATEVRATTEAPSQLSQTNP